MPNKTVLMIMSVRNIKSFTDSVNKLPCEKIWFKGYTEVDLAPIINNFIKNSNFENYFIVPDDIIIKPQQFNLLTNALNRHDIVTGWGMIRQNCNYTTATKVENFMNHCIFKNTSSSILFLHNMYNFSYQTHEINKLPDEFETAFTGWFYTGMKRQVWLEYPFQCLNPPSASSDLIFSRRVLSDKKYKQMCIKKAHVIHLSNLQYMDGEQSLLNMNECFNHQSIIKTF